MKWLTELKEYEVCNIYKVVLWINARSTQIVLHPVWRWANLTTLNSYTCITRASIGIYNLYINLKVVILNCELLYAWHLELRTLTLTLEISHNITRNTNMRCCIYAVWSKTNCNEVVVLNIVILTSRSTNYSTLRKLDNTVVANANTQFILCTEHTERLNSTNLATLNLETLGSINRVEHCTNSCAHNLKTLTAVCSTANDIKRSLRANINCSYVEVVRIWMILTSEHLTHNNTLKATTNGLNLLKTLYFKTNIGQHLSNLLSCQVYVGIIFKPLKRNIHMLNFLYLYLYNF